MPRTMWGIVYGTANPHIRKHILPDDDAELDDPRLLEPGEKLIKVPIDPSHTPETFHAHIAAAVCKDAGVDQLVPIEFVEINKNNVVVQHHVGDVAFYNVPGKTHISIMRGDAGIGHIYDPVTKKFTNPSAAIHPSKLKK